MNRALVTFGDGPHEELLEIALPSFEAFADRHGYEIVIPDFPERPARPQSWWKVPALLTALAEFEESLWIDADCVIMDGSDDLDVPEDAWQAMVRHETADGVVPNCGVWFVRQPMRPFLERVWTMTQFLEHGWWEQAAMVRLLGYELRKPVSLVEETPLYLHTHWLEPGWNGHVNDRQVIDRVRVAHATMFDDRADVMRQWAAKAASDPVAA